ncbi:MAG: carboxylesterase family protein [Planctomycetota bacterium]|jgi:predicted peptidase
MKQTLILSIIFALATLSGCNESIQTGQHEATLSRAVTMELDYLIYLPDDYGKTDDSWPLMIFLHGAGERGSNLNLVKQHGPPKLVEEGKDLPFIIVSPQCPADKWWANIPERIMALVDEITEKYNVDENRVYLTGLSMGGYGTWALAATYPDRFAAIAPVCGGGIKFLAYALKDVPVWAFHGDADQVVPVQGSIDLVETLKEIGGNAKLTVYPGVGHDSWTQTYNNDQLYQWFLSHSKKQD